MKKLFALSLLLLTACMPLIAENCNSAERKCVRVLFIGNSYTSANDLPGLFRTLASYGGYAVETDSITPNGATLAEAANSMDTLAKISSSKWDFVILQEQSEISAFSWNRGQQMYPAVRALVEAIREDGATPVLFMTWAHRDGVPEYGLEGYGVMQNQVIAGYEQIADELGVAIAPVGYAWYVQLEDRNHIDLWDSDGSHPNRYGTYFAACVLYATLFDKSPEGIAYNASLPDDVVRQLQKIAAGAVLEQKSQWHLPIAVPSVQ